MTPGTVAYVVLRTALALGLAIYAVRSGWRLLPIGGQALSDAGCALFMLAYGSPDVRDSLGWLVVPCLAYVGGWESVAVLRALSEEGASVSDDLSASIVEPLLEYWRVFWDVFFVVPPIVAGGFVLFDLLAPNEWPFPNVRAPLECRPAVVDQGDTVEVRMRVPHGRELGVFTPDRRFLYIVPFTAPGVARFDTVPRMRLPTAWSPGSLTPGGRERRIFVDTGTYTFRLSDMAELSASETCAVRYTGPRAR